MSYFVISNYDGTTNVRVYSQAELIRQINDEDEKNWLLNSISDHIPDSDTNYWDCKSLIIKGEIVTPQSKEEIIVKEWTI